MMWTGGFDEEAVFKRADCFDSAAGGGGNGVAQVCFIGVINPQDPRVKTPQEIRDDLMLAFKYIQKERLGGTDDCGFSPFSIDVKPKYGSPDAARYRLRENCIARRREQAGVAKAGKP
jgi:hypothetical protein